ncbi:MAG TPA: hypothetical protein DEA08_29925 [Planctomycetes bacterium]|nr:hypothetical protein [Planctomycetota bacterium]|tara:strand:- start:1198 stop:1410 length:213 start_codon:yes stop_codon:yes gene_type:complete
MKNGGVCPKCSGTDIYHSPCVMDRGEGNAAMCLAVRRSDPIEARDVGRFEVYVCRKCGFSELYVDNPGEL